MKYAIIVSAILLAGCVTPSADAPIAISISEIHKDPRAYDGNKVRVQGTFDECISYTCEFCETEEALVALNEMYGNLDNPDSVYDEEIEKMCLEVSFYDDKETVAGAIGEDNTRRTRNLASHMMEDLARFTTSTVEATYDAGCYRVQKDVIPLCTDRASELHRAKIVQTHIRRPATHGVINTYGLEALQKPDEETAGAISMAYQQSMSAFAEEKTPPDFIFLVDEMDEWLAEFEIEAAGGACNCAIDGCTEDDWPKRLGDITNETPANPYACWFAEKVSGAWRFPLD